MAIDFSNWIQGTWLAPSIIALRLVMALILGALVGFEREWNKRAAGLRTHILVCVASAMLAILSIEIIHLQNIEQDELRIDPLRIIEAVTNGVAFLAAGLIVFARGRVHGLTTGAGLWMAGAIGLACGLGYIQIALMAAILSVTVLWLLSKFERFFDTKKTPDSSSS